MIRYLFASKDGAFSFADEVPAITKNAKNTAGFIEITKVESFRRVNVAAHCCADCKLIQFEY